MRQIEGQAFRLGRLMLCSRLRLSPHVSQNYCVKIAESNSLGGEGGGIKINKKKLSKKMLYLIWKVRRGNNPNHDYMVRKEYREPFSFYGRDQFVVVIP
jgi:hypothetical protein